MSPFFPQLVYPSWPNHLFIAASGAAKLKAAYPLLILAHSGYSYFEVRPIDHGTRFRG
jgi:hypothetical protein